MRPPIAPRRDVIPSTCNHSVLLVFYNFIYWPLAETRKVLRIVIQFISVDKKKAFDL